MTYQRHSLLLALLLGTSIGLLLPSHTLWHSAHADHAPGHTHNAHSADVACDVTASHLAGLPANLPQDHSHKEHSCDLCLLLATIVVSGSTAWRLHSPYRPQSTRLNSVPRPAFACVGVLSRRGPPA